MNRRSLGIACTTTCLLVAGAGTVAAWTTAVRSITRDSAKQRDANGRAIVALPGGDVAACGLARGPGGAFTVLRMRGENGKGAGRTEIEAGEHGSCAALALGQGGELYAAGGASGYLPLVCTAVARIDPDTGALSWRALLADAEGCWR